MATDRSRRALGVLAPLAVLGAMATVYAPVASAVALKARTATVTPGITAAAAPRSCIVPPALAGRDGWFLAYDGGRMVSLRLTLTDSAGHTVTAQSDVALLLGGRRAAVRTSPAGLTLVRADADVRGKPGQLRLASACPAPAAPAPKPPPRPAPRPTSAPHAESPAPATAVDPVPSASAPASPSPAAAEPTPSPSDPAAALPTEPPSATESPSAVIEVQAPVRTAVKRADGGVDGALVASAAALLLLVGAAAVGAVAVRARRRRGAQVPGGTDTGHPGF